MKRSAALGHALIWLALWAAANAFALQPVPPLQARVTDLTHTLTATQQQQLERTLTAFEQRKGSQIAVLMLPTTQPESIEQYALRVSEQWRLGRKGIDDGALLLIAKDDRALRIEVGYGLEGALTDATAKRIISDIVTPLFKSGDFFAGIDGAITAMISVIDGEPLPTPAPSANAPQRSMGNALPLLFMLVLGVAPMLRRMMGHFPAALTAGSLASVAMWFFAGGLILALVIGFGVLLFTLFSGMGGGRFPGGYYGGGMPRGRIGGGGGGFRGGGGGFGGGGASGRW